MGGSVPFEEALAARLSLFSLSLYQVEDFLDKRPLRYEVYIAYWSCLFSHVSFRDFGRLLKLSYVADFPCLAFEDF